MNSTPILLAFVATVAWLLRLTPDEPSTMTVGCTVRLAAGLMMAVWVIVKLPVIQASPDTVIVQLWLAVTLPVILTLAGQVTLPPLVVHEAAAPVRPDPVTAAFWAARS